MVWTHEKNDWAQMVEDNIKHCSPIEKRQRGRSTATWKTYINRLVEDHSLRKGDWDY